MDEGCESGTAQLCACTDGLSHEKLYQHHAEQLQLHCTLAAQA